jgi:hypothetical protein
MVKLEEVERIARELIETKEFQNVLKTMKKEDISKKEIDQAYQEVVDFLKEKEKEAPEEEPGAKGV